MLGVTTTKDLIFADHNTLKRSPASLPPTYSLNEPPTCSCWSSDNKSLLLAYSSEILRYDASSERPLETIYSYAGRERGAITGLISKDQGSMVIFSKGQQIQVLETLTGRVAQTLDSHRAPITSIALSNDSSLLAATSANAIHVHNLSHGSHTVLRGLPSSGGAITTCAFHLHTRTRLLVGAGTQMLVYDTTRPSAPVKTFTLSTQRGGWGEIVSVSSSPFSKTLVAVASSGGNICLVDLEKEKGLCRTLTLHVPLTSLVFSAEGGTLYAGTENGKVLVQDLRTLDKGPRSITVSERGDRVTSLAIQGKLKSEQSAPKATASTVTTASQPLVPQDVNQDLARATGLTGGTKPLFADKPVTQSKPNPVSPTSARASSTTPADTMAGVSESPRLARTRTRAAAPGSPIVSKKAFSPPRSPATRTRKASDLSDGLDISVRVEDLLAVPPAKRVKENLHPTATVLAPSAAKSEADPLSAASRASRTRDGSRVRARTAAAARPTTSVNSRMRSISGSSAGTSASTRTGQSRGALTEHKSASRVASPVRAVHALRSRASRTPSPNLPSVADAPVTPPPNATRKGKEKERMSGMNVLGLGTPELERWIRAGEGNVHDKDDGVHDRAGGKRVGFASQAEPHANAEDPDRLSAGAAPSLAVQLSPRRRPPSSSAASAWAAVPSPLRNLSSTQVGTGTSPAADLLQGILRDAMHDFRQETRQEIVGLHLDMLRMGRGIKNELRAVMDEFRGEMDKLREENCKLRAENERLRRGY